MEFFDMLGKKASKAAKVTADKTGKLAKETKIKFRINELRAQINDIYEEIGKKVYEKHIREEEICIKKDLEEQCTKIDVLSDEIDTLLKECLDLKDKRQCQECYKEIEKDFKFCPNCGEEQVQEQIKEIDVVVEENVQQEEEKSNLEKTVEIESNVKLEEDDEEGKE